MNELFFPAEPYSVIGLTSSNGLNVSAVTSLMGGRLDTENHAIFRAWLPGIWDRGPITYRVNWTARTVVLPAVSWALQATANIDAPYGDAVCVEDTSSLLNALQVSPESDPVYLPVANDFAGDHLCYFRLFRDREATILSVRIFFVDTPTFTQEGISQGEKP